MGAITTRCDDENLNIFFLIFSHTTAPSQNTNGRDAQSIGRNDVLQAHENAKQQQEE
jgi:hypothetical protein